MAAIHFIYFETLRKQLKRNLTSNINNLVYKLPHKLRNILRLRISGNEEKYQICVQTKLSA